MPDIFAVTAGWGHLADKSQPHHALAARIYRLAKQNQQRIVTTNYILGEVVALLTSPLHVPRQQQIAFINSIKTSPHVEVIHIDPTLDAAAWQLFSDRSDKLWSLVDCSSFVVMQRLGIYDALTTDHHFAQAGFRPLLRE